MKSKGYFISFVPILVLILSLLYLDENRYCLYIFEEQYLTREHTQVYRPFKAHLLATDRP